MLGLILYIFGLVFVQGCATYVMEDGENVDRQLLGEITLMYGSVHAAMFTLYQAAFGGNDWAVFFDVIQVTGALNSAIFVFYVAFIQIALVNILTGIFVDNAMQIARPDQDALALEQSKTEAEVASADELRRICLEADINESGGISLDEMRELFRSDDLKKHLKALGFDVAEASIFFNMLAASHHHEDIPIDAFVRASMRLKGKASSLDMQAMLFETGRIQREQVKLASELKITHSEVLQILRELHERVTDELSTFHL